MGKNVKVDILTKRDLRQAVANSTYWGPGKNAPISKNRACWILESPRLKEDDYCLLVGLENDKMIAFVYMLPDILNDPNRTKVYWMIEWWVVPAYQNSVLSTYIFMEGMRLAGDNILIKFYAEHIKHFYDKQPFSELHTRMRHAVFFGLNPDLVVRKIKFAKYAKFLVKAIDRLISSRNRKLNKKKAISQGGNLKFEYINQLDREIEEWLISNCEDDLILKTKDYLNWQFSTDQYLTTPLFDKVYEKVQLRDYAPVMDLHTFKVISEGDLIGFICFSDHGGEIYLKYFVSNEQNFDTNLSALMLHLIKLKTSHIFTDNELVGEALTKNYKTTFTHKVKKVALAHNAIIEKTKGLILKEQDGNYY
ncbi:hypothetical protein [Spongiivirga citrea]|uniref:GNAT family N-acetyltransferase n=1 Tax=Spongiivirga citrea TaxID=1481457 RepID=A0A6M0CH98_9FLAO|nr:hypothetical protein [Spongiivirga citrea]NER16882.1 hypothetical protein [Spongiivirga citrea]